MPHNHNSQNPLGCRNGLAERVEKGDGGRAMVDTNNAYVSPITIRLAPNATHVRRLVEFCELR